MIRSSVTVSLVPELRGGPFIFWDDLAAACRKAREIGFDGIEVFAPSADAVPESTLRALLMENGLALAAMGTGAGWVKHRLSLTSPDAGIRTKAKSFIRGIIDRAGTFGAPAIIGSMQGRFGDGVDRPTALARLAEALNDLSEHAKRQGVPLLFEPINRYESNLIATIADGVALLQSASTSNVKLLADLFHMNIEEANLPEAIRAGGSYIGHVHFVDSNRKPAGRGHLDFPPIIAALREIGYNGFLSAEALPDPDPVAAARQTIEAFATYVAS